MTHITALFVVTNDDCEFDARFPLGIVISSAVERPCAPKMSREYIFYVYIMQSSSRRALYIGMTNNLHRRVFEHKNQQSEGFAAAYDVVRLVYWESFDNVANAIDREKQLKRWRREKKLWLIGRFNPQWKDLAVDWYTLKINTRSLDCARDDKG